jgi:hypothetical protein
MRAINYLFFSFILLFLYSCNETHILLPDSHTLNGKITFIDSNFTLGGGGQYVVYAWREPRWYPLSGDPTSSQVIDIVKTNNKYVLEYQYRLANVTAGTYVASLMYTDGSSFFKILGVYSCTIPPVDSTCFRTPNRYATIVTTEGLLDIDIMAYGDTTAARP